MRLATNVLLAGLLLVSAASTSNAQIGGWVSANASLATPIVTTVLQTDSFRCCSPGLTGTLESSARYATLGELAADIGGGLRLSRRWGLGVAMSRYAHDAFADISLSVPHPLFVGRPATATGKSQAPMKQNETSLHLEARYVGNLPHASVALFAGPSYLRANRDLIDNISFTDSLGSTTQNYTVTLTGNSVRRGTISKWGFNVGADVGYYFGDKLGVGVLVRYSRATADLPNLLDSDTATQPYTMGTLSVGAGLRFRL